MKKRRKGNKGTVTAVPSISRQAGALSPSLLTDVRRLIEGARQNAAAAVNDALTGLYWHIGSRVRVDVLKQERAQYGQHIVSALSRQLTQEYGPGFSE